MRFTLTLPQHQSTTKLRLLAALGSHREKVMEIRKVEFSEIDGVLDLIDEFDRRRSPWPSETNKREIFNAIELTGGCIFGAFNHNKIIGTCTVNICPNFSWSGRSYAIIENVIVSKTYRNKGIGKLLLLSAKLYAEKYNCYKVALMTGSKEESVLNFYKSAGFEGNKIGYQVRFQA